MKTDLVGFTVVVSLSLAAACADDAASSSQGGSSGSGTAGGPSTMTVGESMTAAEDDTSSGGNGSSGGASATGSTGTSGDPGVTGDSGGTTGDSGESEDSGGRGSGESGETGATGSGGTSGTESGGTGGATGSGSEDTGSGDTESGDTESGDTGGESTGGESTGGESTGGESTGGDTGAMGMSCVVHGDCEHTGYCLSYSDAPPDLGANCQPEPPEFRMTATVRAFETREAVAGADFRAVAEIPGVLDPLGASMYATAVSDADGRIDVLSTPLARPPGAYLAVNQADGYYPTSTFLAREDDMLMYPPGNVVHDLWLIEQATLETWSATLDADPTFPDALLPFGGQSGAAILVRDLATGTPLSGALVEPVDGDSDAVIRYLAADGLSLTDSTSDLGVAFVNFSVLPDDVAVFYGGEVVAVFRPIYHVADAFHLHSVNVDAR